MNNLDLLMLAALCCSSVTVYGSQKKGISVNPNAFLCDDLKVLDNVVWWYDWGPNLDITRTKSGCLNIDEHIDHHVPMAWGYGSYFQRYYLHDQAEFLLGFNEPNHKEQSNILAEDAARYWPEVERLAAGRPLVSPAAAPCGGANCNGNTKEWFDLFFKSCNGCRFDYLATHVYKCDANKTMNFLEDLYKTYNLTIWLTEFACPYKTNPDRQLRYMKELLPRLEEAPYILRYAWFIARVTEKTATTFIPTSVSLFEPNSSNLTTLGKFYNSFTSTKTTPTRPTRFTTPTKTTFRKTTTKTSTVTMTTPSQTVTTTLSSTTTDGQGFSRTSVSTTRKYDTTTDGGSIINSANKNTSANLLIFYILISALLLI